MIPGIGLRVKVGKKSLDPLWIATGYGTNNVAKSTDGVNWTGLGTAPLSSYGQSAATNGEYVLVLGSGERMRKTSDLTVSSWTTVGTGIFTSRAYYAAWNGSMWVAMGTGTNGMAYSYDGVNWTGLGTSIFTTGRYVKWNGSMWVAVGTGTYKLAYSTNGTSWTGVTLTSSFSTGTGVAWNGTVWKAVGAGGTYPLWTSSNGTTWTPSSFPLLSPNCILWNGSLWIVGGTSNANYCNIASSPDGTTWTNRDYGIAVNEIAFDGSKYVAVGINPTDPMIRRSTDGLTWTSGPSNIFTNTTVGATGVMCIPNTLTPQIS